VWGNPKEKASQRRESESARVGGRPASIRWAGSLAQDSSQLNKEAKEERNETSPDPNLGGTPLWVDGAFRASGVRSRSKKEVPGKEGGERGEPRANENPETKTNQTKSAGKSGTEKAVKPNLRN